MQEAPRKDTWSAGDLYEPYVGRWSRLVARELLEWLGVPWGREWVDVGCGTGALAETILDRNHPKSVIGVDPSPRFAEYATEHVRSARATFKVGDAQSLPLDADSADVVVSGLVLNFVPQPQRAVEEKLRVVRPGGVVAAYVWDYAGKMELMRYFWDAAVELDPAARDLDEGQRFTICQPDPLADLFTLAGVCNVETRPLDVLTPFRNFDDYWIPFLGGQAPAPGYAMSLKEEKRDELRDLIRSRLPTAGDGSIRLVARAWGVRGRAAAP